MRWLSSRNADRIDWTAVRELACAELHRIWYVRTPVLSFGLT